MARIRRSANIFVLFSDRAAVNLKAFFSGKVDVQARTQVLGIAIASGKSLELNAECLSLLASIDSQVWQSQEAISDRFNIDSSLLDQLVDDGFLITDDPCEPATLRREMDEKPDRVNWNPHQALAYVMARWVDTRPADRKDQLAHHFDDFEGLVRAYGTPPGHFHQVRSSSRTALPAVKGEGELSEILLKRQTARGFRTDQPMLKKDLAQLLSLTFGAQAVIPLAEGFKVLKKTSPSGGALHPVEAYPLVMNVEGIECGLYHYNVESHSLDRVEALTESQARSVAFEMTTGQDYFASADVLIVLTGRYQRTFWKYRNHAKARRVVELDAGHLSQTFYLVATELGYGPFITAAIADHVIEKMLALPYLEEGAIAVVGCGTSADDRQRLD